MPSMERAGLPFNLVGQFGQDGLAEHLRVDQDLMSRYADYEEMDEYPEISCLSGASMVFTLEAGWQRIDVLAVRGESFHVLSYDKERRSLVPSVATRAWKSGEAGHAKQMVRVVLDSGGHLECTSDHRFLTKDGRWVEAGSLTSGERLMPGYARMRSLNADDAAPYWQVHQPHDDSTIRSTDGKRWVWIHRLVAEELLGVRPGAGEIVHHKNVNQLDNGPSNLSIETYASHASEHIAGIDNSRFLPAWSQERREAKSAEMLGNTYSRGTVRSEAHRRAIGDASRRPKSAEHKARIGMSQPNRIDLDHGRLEAALCEANGSVAEAARTLGVSWSTVKRKAVALDLMSDQGNHRVLCVERLEGSPDVFDLEVPGYHNFVCDGVVVHNSAYDIYADDSTMPDMEEGKSIWVVSENEQVAKELDLVLHKRCQIEDDIWGLNRTLGKYGNAFGELVVAEQGLVGINYMPPATCRRVEDPRGKLLGFVQDTRGEFNLSLEDFYQKAKAQEAGRPSGRGTDEMTVFEDWEVIHWRLRGKHMRSVYGHGVADPARWIWKRLALLEDAILIYKLSRAPSRYAFYIDVGELDNQRGLAYVNQVKNNFIKKKFMNPTTGKLDMRHNPLSMDEDFFIPSRNGKDSTRIEVLQGPDYAEVETLEYHRDKLVAGLKVPKTYLGFGGESNRASLSSEDIRFARTVMRIQRETRGGYRRACRVHLVAIGADAERIEYDVQMSVPSAILELAKLEVLSATADVAQRMGEQISTRWILTKLYKFTEEEALRLMDEREEEQIRKGQTEADIQSMAMQAQADIQAGAQADADAQAGDEGQDAGQEAGQEARITKTSKKRLDERRPKSALDWRGKRISELMSARRKNWREEFERGTPSRYGEDKLHGILRNDKALAKRLKSIEGMLGDIQSALRK